MPRGDKSVADDKQKRPAGRTEKGAKKKAVARPEAEARAWAAAGKLHGGAGKFGPRQKLPSGPLGGSGRKTNLSRSS